MSKKLKKMTSIQLNRIAELSSQGLSCYAIARQMNIPSGVARYHVDKQRIKQLETLHNPLNTDEPDTQLKEAIKAQIALLQLKQSVLTDLLN